MSAVENKVVFLSYPPAPRLRRAGACWGEGRRPESDAALEELTRFNADTVAYQIVQVHAFRGEVDCSFEWLERALRQRDPGLITMKTDPLLETLRADARWPIFLRKIGVSEGQLK